MADNAMYNKLKNDNHYQVTGYVGDSSVASKLSNGGYISNGAVFTPVQDTYTPPSNTGSKTGKGTSTATTGGSFDLAGYLAGINAQRQAAAEAAYANARNALNDAYGKASESYANIYNSGVDQLGRSYENSRGKINSEATDAFRQAYVNRMLSEKNLGQRMAAMGMSGGAAESTLAGLINNYGNSRNGIQKTLDTNLGDLEMNYQGNLADLYNAYQSQMASLANQRASQMAQLEMNLANQIASSGGDYFSALMSNSDLLKSAMTNAVNAQNAYVAPEVAKATNDYVAANTQQANDMGSQLTRWWEDQLQKQLAGGLNENGTIYGMKDTGISPQALADMLNKINGVA